MSQPDPSSCSCTCGGRKAEQVIQSEAQLLARGNCPCCDQQKCVFHFHRKETGELLDDLDDFGQSDRYAAVALVLGGAENTELVFANDGSRMRRLATINKFVKSGMNPVGFIGVTERGMVHTRTLPNYRDNAQVEQYLENVKRACLSDLLAMCSIAEVSVQ
jgi:hypothetical protein